MNDGFISGVGSRKGSGERALKKTASHQKWFKVELNGHKFKKERREGGGSGTWEMSPPLAPIRKIGRRQTDEEGYGKKLGLRKNELSPRRWESPANRYTRVNFRVAIFVKKK